MPVKKRSAFNYFQEKTSAENIPQTAFPFL